MRLKYVGLIVLLLLLSLLMSGCKASLPRVVITPETQLPSVELMAPEEESSKNFSQKVQDWQQRALKELKDLEPKPLPCKITSSGCA